MKKLLLLLFFTVLLSELFGQQVLINTPSIPNVNIQRIRNDIVSLTVRFQNQGVPINVINQNFFFSFSEAQSGLVRLELSEGAGISQIDSATITISLTTQQVAALTKDVYQYRLYTSLNEAVTTKLYGAFWLVKGTLTGSSATVNVPILIINYTTNGVNVGNSIPNANVGIVETDPTVSPAAKVITNSNVQSWNQAVLTLPNKVNTTDPRLSDARTPTAHNQGISTITNLQDSLAKKSDSTHRHPISKINGLQDELSKKQDKGVIDYNYDIVSNMLLVNNVTNQKLRIWIGSDTAEAGFNKHKLYVNLDTLQGLNTWSMIDTDGGVYGYQHKEQRPGTVGMVWKLIFYKYKYKVGSVSSYSSGRRIILMHLDSLEFPFSLHYKISFNVDSKTYTPIDYLPEKLWASNYKNTNRGQLLEAVFQRKTKLPRFAIHVGTLALLPTTRYRQARPGRQSAINKYSSTHIS